jgi:large subunit ribosomal protein L21
MKYAIVEDGGKQYKVVEGSTVEVDYLSNVEIGEEMDLPNVLLISNEDQIHVGTPYLNGTVVKARVKAQLKGPKVIIFKYTPKKRYRAKAGHRQMYTQLVIEAIQTEQEN